MMTARNMKEYQNKPTPADKITLTANIASNLGKLPPQAIDLEEVVLGACILFHGTFDKIIEYMEPEIFYKESHQIICRALISLHEKERHIDILTVIHDLKDNDELEHIGGDSYIVSLAMRVGTDWHIESWLLIIWEKFILRENIRISSETIQTSFDNTTDAFMVLEGSKNKLEELGDRIKKGINSDFKTAARETVREIVELSEGGKITGVPSYIATLDAITHGSRKSEVTIIAARPGMGKTTFAIQMMINQVITNNLKALFFSVEMSKAEIVKKIFSNQTTTNSLVYNSGKMAMFDKENMTTTLNKIENIGLFIDDTAGIKIDEIFTRAKKLHKTHKLDIIYIDYMQKVEVSDEQRKNRSREQEINLISGRFKKLAKQLNIPVVVLAQLSREVEKRTPPIPKLSDLRESGSIEQDADVVIFLYRPEYYKQNQDEMDADIDGKCFVYISKNRNGILSKTTLACYLQFSLFQDEHLTPPTLNYSEPLREQTPDPIINPNIKYSDETPF